MGLLIVICLPTFFTCIGCYTTASRILWTLARGGATPFSGQIRQLSPSYGNPANATIICGALCTVIGVLLLGSTTAFNALVGSFVSLGSLSYLGAILPHLLLRRREAFPPGPFSMSKRVGTLVNAVSRGFMVLTIVIFCFPYATPVDTHSMNYTSAILGGLTVIIAVLFMWKRPTSSTNDGFVTSM
jgi:choline transport protein